ncbi:uncharacterized protein V6R79_019498 [Siganus canaliculatus]
MSSPSIFLSLPVSISACPVLSLSTQPAPTGNLKISTTTPTIQATTISPTVSSTASKISPQLCKKSPLRTGPVLHRPVPHQPLKPLKQIFCNITNFLPPLCKFLTFSFNVLGPHLTKKTTHPAALHAAKVPPINSTLPPTSSSLPVNASVKRSFPVSTLPSTSDPQPSLAPPESSVARLSPPSLPHTMAPLFEHQPFIVTWNIPDLVCTRYNISLDTSPFKGVATPAKVNKNKSMEQCIDRQEIKKFVFYFVISLVQVPGQFLSLFYTDRLGLYPHVDPVSGKQINGGIPQRVNLKASMSKAREDINYYIPSKSAAELYEIFGVFHLNSHSSSFIPRRTSRGLAVIDWEEWRPLWDRNWGSKRVYQTLSVAHVMHANGSLTVQQATEKAKEQFEEAAQSFMSGMLALGRAMRPNYLWGFYLFPNCYNYGWESPRYTGRCSTEVRKQNDELLWMWGSSTALYPSVYLQVSLADNPKAALMVRNRVQEALRVSSQPAKNSTAPVFVYTRPVFVDHNRRFLSQGDLVSTIGESAALGASGAVVWGASADYDDQTSCEALSSYLSSTLNPYITNVTAAAQLCSNFLCRGNGRCVRKNYNTSHYLHLNPENFRVVYVERRYLAVGRPTFTDLKALSRRFTCQCYRGLQCTPRTYKELAKALKFTLKPGLYQKTHALNKANWADRQQDSMTKDNVRKNLKV